jgi:hypothetical protein
MNKQKQLYDYKILDICHDKEESKKLNLSEDTYFDIKVQYNDSVFNECINLIDLFIYLKSLFVDEILLQYSDMCHVNMKVKDSDFLLTKDYIQDVLNMKENEINNLHSLFQLEKNDYENHIFYEVLKKLFDLTYNKGTQRVEYITPRYDNQLIKYESIESELN